MKYVVIHQNPNHPDIQNGEAWAVDGLDEQWTEIEASKHAMNCAYASVAVPHTVVPLEDLHEYRPDLVEETGSKRRKAGSRSSSSVQQTDDNAQ